MSPKIIRFDVVQQKDQFAVAPELKKFYQAEVLVPSPIPPHLIEFPKQKESVLSTQPPSDSMTQGKSQTYAIGSRTSDLL